MPHSERKNTDFIRYFYYFCELDIKNIFSHQKSHKNNLASCHCGSVLHLRGSTSHPVAAGADICRRQSDEDSFRETGR